MIRTRMRRRKKHKIKHVKIKKDLCDCLLTKCAGCFFPCPKCKSTKCGPSCRRNRSFKYICVTYEEDKITKAIASYLQFQG